MTSYYSKIIIIFISCYIISICLICSIKLKPIDINKRKYNTSLFQKTTMNLNTNYKLNKENNFKNNNRILDKDKIINSYQKNLNKKDCVLVDTHNPFKKLNNSSSSINKTEQFYFIFVILICFTYALIKQIFSKNNYFFSCFFTKSAVLVTSSNLLLILLIMFAHILNYFYVFDSLKINIEPLISCLTSFVAMWIFFNLIIIKLLESFYLKEWRVYEKSISDYIFNKEIIHKSDLENDTISPIANNHSLDFEELNINTKETESLNYKLNKDNINSNFNKTYNISEYFVNKTIIQQNKNHLYNIKKSSNIDNYKEISKFGYLKASFCKPFYSYLKSSNLSFNNIDFCLYLENCLIFNLNKFFSVNAFSCIFLLITMGLYLVFIAYSKAIYSFYILITFAYLIIISYIFLYIYIRNLTNVLNNDEYSSINFSNNDLNKNCTNNNIYIDVNQINTERIKIKESCIDIYMLPNYLKYFVNKKDFDFAHLSNNSKIMYSINYLKYKKHVLSPYENLYIFGKNGLNIIFNLIQLLCVLSISWICVVFYCHVNYDNINYKESKELSKLNYYKNKLTISELMLAYFTSILLVITIIVLSIICISRYTKLTCLETERNNKALYNTIEESVKKTLNITNQLVESFKLLYYYINLFESDFSSVEEIVKYYKSSEITESKLSYDELISYYLFEQYYLNIALQNSTDNVEIENIKEKFNDYSYKSKLSNYLEKAELNNNLLANNEEYSREVVLNSLIDNIPIKINHLNKYFNSRENCNFNKDSTNNLTKYLKLNIHENQNKNKNDNIKILLKDFKNVTLFNYIISKKKTEEIIAEVIGKFLAESRCIDYNEGIKKEIINIKTIIMFLNEYKAYFSNIENAKLLEICEDNNCSFSIETISKIIAMHTRSNYSV